MAADIAASIAAETLTAGARLVLQEADAELSLETSSSSHQHNRQRELFARARACHHVWRLQVVRQNLEAAGRTYQENDADI